MFSFFYRIFSRRSRQYLVR